MLALSARLLLCAVFYFAASARARDRATGEGELLATLRLSNPASARPLGMAVSTAVPFAPGVVEDVADLGFSVPAEAEALERHADGSVKWARIRILPAWTAPKSTFVELRRGGVRPPLPRARFEEFPGAVLVLEDPSGAEWHAEVGDFEVVEKNALRQVLRARGGHRMASSASLASVPAAGTGNSDRAFFQYELFVERYPGERFFIATLLLRNDPPSAPIGPVRFQSYRLTFRDPSVRVAVAWAKQNGCQYIDGSLQRGTVLLLPKGTKDLWLGDGQTKAWRLCVDSSGDTERFQALATILERPILPGLPPGEIIRSQAWGDLGDMVIGPPPQTAAKLAAEVFFQTRQQREYGWAGPWGDVKDTHNTGSPRNALCSDGVLRSLQTGYREWFDLTWEKVFQHALRPIVRGIRASDHPDLLLYEGMPHPKWKDRLGREARPDPFFERFRDGPAGGYLQATHGWNGFDQEHFSIDDLYAAHLLTGDPWLRFELESIGQALLTYPFAKQPVSLHTSRGDGWVLRGLCLLYRALGDERYLEAARSLVEGMDAERSKGARKWLHSNGPDPRHLADHPFEIPWQVSIAINGLAAYHRISKDPLAKTIAIDAADFLVKHCWDPARGMFYADVATDDSGAKRDDTDYRGTQSWIPSGLVAAYRLEPRPEFMILANGIYEKVKTYNATFDKGGTQWAWWQSYLRQVFDRGTGRR